MAKRTDANQKEVVKAFRDTGATVQILSDIGKGCPDILVGSFGQNFLIEIKDGNKPLSAQKLTEHEERFHQNWKGQVCIIRSAVEAVSFMEKAKEYISL